MRIIRVCVRDVSHVVVRLKKRISSRVALLCVCVCVAHQSPGSNCVVQPENTIQNSSVESSSLSLLPLAPPSLRRNRKLLLHLVMSLSSALLVRAELKQEISADKVSAALVKVFTFCT